MSVKSVSHLQIILGPNPLHHFDRQFKQCQFPKQQMAAQNLEKAIFMDSDYIHNIMH